MHLVCYLAHDTSFELGVQKRLEMAQPPLGLVTVRSLPELISRAQTLPISAVVADASWPREVWEQLRQDLKALKSDTPIFVLAQGPVDFEWWQYADELLHMEESAELFINRLERAGKSRLGEPNAHCDYTQPGILADYLPPPPSSPSENVTLLEQTQFQQFAAIFSTQEVNTMIEAFVAWALSVCQTSRVVLLLRDPKTGNFVCQAHRGLPSALVPHCSFTQTAPICRWLNTGRVLILEQAIGMPNNELVVGLELMQAVAAVPIIFDGQLIGILGMGPRLVGHGYSDAELEGLFVIAGQVAAAVDHSYTHRTIKLQQEMTEHMLGVMPTGSIVLGQDQRIAFVNPTAAAILGKPRAALHGMDLRTLPSPLGDLAFESLTTRKDLPRRECVLAPSNRPIAVSAYVLASLEPSSMLLIEDCSAQKRLAEERERRVDLEVVTNLVHYLAHELCNPLVTLSTFSNLMPARASDADFQEFCDTVLQPEIGRVQLILEQLLVLTHHAEFQFSEVDLNAMLERVTGSEEMRASVVTSIPVTLPTLYGDAHRFETALTCIMRSISRLGSQQTPATMQVSVDGEELAMRIEVLTNADLTPEWLLNPWQQLMSGPEKDVDFGVATAHYIFSQHQGSLSVAKVRNLLTIDCRVPLRAEREGGEELWHDTKESANR